MSAASKIEWTDKTWNPVRGCSLVSAGCANCYAMKWAHRFSGKDQPYEGLTEIGPHGPRWTGKIRLVHDALDEPLHWKKPCRIFVNSMSDLFHENVPQEFIIDTYAVMITAYWHTFQILTKRPQRRRRLLSDLGFRQWVADFAAGRINKLRGPHSLNATKNLAAWHAGAAHNIHEGVSIEDQATADERIPLLLETPAAVRFISAEPLLGPVDIKTWLPGTPTFDEMMTPRVAWNIALDWVIVGGESKDGARPMHPDWARMIRDQCLAAGVPFFFKQWGEWKPISQMADGEADALHVSRRKANQHEDQAALDELYGRHCTVKTQTIRYDGVAFPEPTEGAYELRDGHPAMLCFKVGKKAAGALLDGREWKEFPR